MVKGGGEYNKDVTSFRRHWVRRHGSFYAERGDVIEPQGAEELSLTMYSNAEASSAVKEGWGLETCAGYS